MGKILNPDENFALALSTRTIPLRVNYVSSGMRNSDLPASVAPELALIGRSNVGKSSLLNFMAGQKNLARVSSTPGRTQTINLFSCEKDAMYLVDLPGYGFARTNLDTRSHWQTAMAEFLKEREGLFGALFLVDIRREVEAEDAILAKWLLDIGLSVLVVQTKCDKVHKSELPLLRQKHAIALGTASGMVASTSAEKKIGLDSLFAGIAGMLENHAVESQEDEHPGAGRP